MLAETFEEPRMKFIAEKVSHNPFVMAYHAEGEKWELYGLYCVKPDNVFRRSLNVLSNFRRQN